MEKFFDKIFNILGTISAFLIFAITVLFIYTSYTYKLRIICIILLILNLIITAIAYIIEFILKQINKKIKISITDINRKEKK